MDWVRLPSIFTHIVTLNVTKNLANRTRVIGPQDDPFVSGYGNSYAASSLQQPTDQGREVSKDGGDDKHQRKRSRQKDEDTSSGNGQRLPKRVFSQSAQNHGQYKRDDRVVQLFHDIAQEAEPEHHPDIKEVVVDAEGPNGGKNDDKTHKARIWNTQHCHEGRDQEEVHEEKHEVADIHA